ncbi:unnamed protein product, partial [Didymodactylos carnosus]
MKPLPELHWSLSKAVSNSSTLSASLIATSF